MADRLSVSAIWRSLQQSLDYNRSQKLDVTINLQGRRMSKKIFVSYSSQEPELAEELEALLTGEGYAVWWDNLLSAGQAFHEEIENQLDLADAVIVIWTAQSISSTWVTGEAAYANRRGKLITLRTRDLDPQDIPLPFNTLHTPSIDQHPAILAAVRRKVNQPGEQVLNAPTPNTITYSGSPPPTKWRPSQKKPGPT
jgi:TIR domain